MVGCLKKANHTKIQKKEKKPQLNTNPTKIQIYQQVNENKRTASRKIPLSGSRGQYTAVAGDYFSFPKLHVGQS